MSDLKFIALPTATARAYRAGQPDANGMVAERGVSNGTGNPCRHCLRFIPEGVEMLILAHRPFASVQPYAESGPIFLCADDCARWEGDGVPPVLAPSDNAEERLLKGYSAANRIVYGLDRVVPPEDIPHQAQTILADPRVEYVHIRSSTNNCFTCRVEPER